MPVYPLVLIPPELQRVARTYPDVSTPRPKPPRAPGREPNPVDFTRVALQTGGVMLLTAILTRFQTWLGAATLAVGVVAILVHVYLQMHSFSARLQSHSQHLEAYFRLLEAYSRQESEYLQDVAVSRAPEKLQPFRASLVREAIAKFPQVDWKIGAGALSPGAVRLGESLAHYYAGGIQPHAAIHLPSPAAPIAFPFIYTHGGTGLHVAIGIAGVKEQRDEFRDRLLVKSGWLVMWFAEEQAARSPEGCCKVLANVLDGLLSEELLAAFADVDDLESTARSRRKS